MGYWENNFDNIKLFCTAVKREIQDVIGEAQCAKEERETEEQEAAEDLEMKRLLSYFWEDTKSIERHIFPNPVAPPIKVGGQQVMLSGEGFWIRERPNAKDSFFAVYAQIQRITMEKRASLLAPRFDLTLHVHTWPFEADDGEAECYTLKGATQQEWEALTRGILDAFAHYLSEPHPDLSQEEVSILEAALERIRESVRAGEEQIHG